MSAEMFDLRSLSTETLEAIFQALRANFGEPEDRLYASVSRVLNERDGADQ